MTQSALKPAPRRMRDDLRASSADGFSFSVMVGIGETYVPAFILASGLGATTAGLAATVPLLIGSLLQMISPWAIRRLDSHRAWVVGCAVLQALSLLALPVMVVTHCVSTIGIFTALSFYWAAGLATGPAWNQWVETLIPPRIRSRFFGQRSRLCQFGVVLGIVAGGIALRGSGDSMGATHIFAGLFAVAAVCRLVSAAMLASQSEPDHSRRRANEAAPINDSPDSQAQSISEQTAAERSAWRFVTYLVLVQTSVFIAGPFFTPFMLGVLKLSYFEYTVLIGLGYVGKLSASSLAARLAERFGAHRLLWVGGIGIVPLSSMWLVSTAFPFLMVLQISGGILWACYMLAMQLMFFQEIPRERRVSIMTLYNVGNSFAMVIGSLIGAAILWVVGTGRDAYLIIFLLSTVARGCTLFFLPGFKPVYLVHASRYLMTRTIAVRPMGRLIERPLFAADTITSRSRPAAIPVGPDATVPDSGSTPNDSSITATAIEPTAFAD